MEDADVGMKNIFMVKCLGYHVGSPDGWSTKYSFRTIPNEDRKSFAVYGDLGVTNAQSLGRLQKEAQLDIYDAILHVGDFAYGKSISKHEFFFYWGFF